MSPELNANPPQAGSFFTLLLAFSIVFLFAQFAWFAAMDFFNSPTVPILSLTKQNGSR